MNISDVGRRVFTVPDVFCDGASEWLECPGYDIDTEAIIILDEETGKLGYVYIRGHRQGDCKNTREATMWLIDENRHQRFYETQEAAIRAALQSEREYAETIIRACDVLQSKLDGGDKQDGNRL